MQSLRAHDAGVSMSSCEVGQSRRAHALAERSQELCWFLVLTKPAGEALAEANLVRQGFSVYCPRLLRPSVRRGRRVQRIVALFPRYVFVQLDTARQSLAPIRSTLGVVSVVRFGADAAVVPDGIVEALISRADPESGLHRLHQRAFEPGMCVSLVAGAFEGLDGVFEREAGNERVVVLLKLLGRSTPVRVPYEFVRPKCA